MRVLVTSLLVCTLACSFSSCSGPNEPKPEVKDLAAVISVDSVSCPAGNSVDVSISLEWVEDGPRIDSIQSFIFKVAYDDSLLHCIDCELGEAGSTWDYFTWREFPSHRPYELRAHLAIIAVRKLNSRDSTSAGERMTEGTLAVLTFQSTADSGAIGSVAEISFSSVVCSDNVLVDAADDNTYHMTRYNSSNDPHASTVDTLECLRRYRLLPDLAFVSGGIEITAPPYVPPDPAITVSLETFGGAAGDTVDASISIAYGQTPPYIPPGFGGLQFSITYDSAAVTPVEVIQGEELIGWEYFTWRKRPLEGSTPRPGFIIVSILEMNNGEVSTGSIRPRGDLAVVRFRLNRELSSADACKAVRFWSSHPGDNIIVDLGGNEGFLPLPESSVLLFDPTYDTTDCGGIVYDCQMIVEYAQPHCPD